MAVYLVERHLPDITNEQLAAAQQSAIATADRLREGGESVRYLRSMFVPGEARCLCLFESSDPDVVVRLNEEAGLPYTRVIEALDLAPPADPGER